MRTTFCPRAGEIVLRDEEIPRPERAGEALLRVRGCGICGSDLHWYKGESPPPLVCPGHEISAVVHSLGPGSHPVREGDRVAVEATRSCGRCRFCREGRTQLCPRLQILGMTIPGGFADYLVTDSRHVYAVPDAMEDEVVQLAEPLAVDVHAMRLAGLPTDGRVLVLGGGTLGLLCVTAARAAGAGEIVVSARRPHQQKAARALGAHHVIGKAHAGADPEREQDDFDVVLDTVADPAGSLDQALAAVRPGGTVVVLGVFRTRPRFDAVRLMAREIRMLGSMCYGAGAARSDFETALELLEDDGGRIRACLVTHRVDLCDLAEGFRLAADKTTGSIKVSVAISATEPQ